MADNLVIDEGTSSKSARTDEISANLHVPFVKLMDGTTDGTTAALVDANGLEVQGAGTAGTPAGGVVSVQGVGSGTTLPTTEASGSAIKTAVELIDDAVYADDADWTDSTSKHVLVGGLYQSTPQTITDGDVGPLQTDSTGKLLIGNTSIAGTAGTANSNVLSVQGIASMTPVQTGLAVANCVQWSTYSNSYTSAQTSQDLVAASGSTKIYVGYLSVSCNYNTSNAGRTTVQIYFGTGAVSDTSKHVWRGTFAPVPATSVEAYPGVVIGSGVAPFFISAASDALKITTTTSGTHCGVSVTISYIQV